MTDHDEDEIKDADVPEGELGDIATDSDGNEPDFTPSAVTPSFEDDLSADDDPHTSFDAPSALSEEDPHSELFGIKPPKMTSGDEDEEELESDDDEEGVDFYEMSGMQSY